MTNRRLAMMPGGYLILSRYPGIRPVVGFIWLELLPITATLVYTTGWKGLLYPFLQVVFLGLYEVGYLINDLSGTAGERPRVLSGDEIRNCITAFFCFRVALFAVTCWMLAGCFDLYLVGFYATASVAIFGLLVFHTRVGNCRGRLSALRVLTFAALSYLKYLPGALLFLSPISAALLLFPLFVAYGAGRVVDYSANKLCNISIGQFFNHWWFLLSLPVLYAFFKFHMFDVEGWVPVFVLGGYFLFSTVKNLRVATSVVERKGA